MLDRPIGSVRDGLASGLGGASEGMAAYVLTLALSPMGLTLMGAALLFALWKARG